jgi:hypothetical protein
MFVGNAKSLPYSETPERGFTQVGSGLSCKHKTGSEKLAREKHSGLSQTFVNCRRKKFFDIDTWTLALCSDGFGLLSNNNLKKVLR